MKHVQTTRGPMPADELGWINAHDHLFVDQGHGAYDKPDFKLDSLDAGIADVTRWRDAGGGAMVDTMPPGAGRNVDKCLAVTEATGVPVVLTSGFHKNYYYFPDHWRYRYDEETLYELILAECAEGCDRGNYLGPIVDRAPVKAGALKVAGQYHYIEPNMLTCIRAVGRAHRTTGVPVYAHTEATPPFELIDRLEDAGVPPESILICHLDRNPDPWLHRKVAERGVYLEYDTPSRVKYQPECRVVGLLRDMLDAGYGDRIMFGGDLARRSYLLGYGGGPGYHYLLDGFTPRLRDEGFAEGTLRRFWHDNPAAWLTHALPDSS